jgi:hypothetical protein
MTGQFQQAVKRAFATFLTEITAAAKHEAIEAIHSAFAQALHPAGDAVAAAGTPVPPSEQRAHRRAVTRIDRVAVREVIVRCIRENPGWDTAQLGRHLTVVPSKLRRHLRISRI